MTYPEIEALADDKAWLTAVGMAMHGERWQRPLAADLGLSAGYVNRIMAADETKRLKVTKQLRLRLAEFVEAELPKRLAAFQYQSALLSAASLHFRGPAPPQEE